MKCKLLRRYLRKQNRTGKVPRLYTRAFAPFLAFLWLPVIPTVSLAMASYDPCTIPDPDFRGVPRSPLRPKALTLFLVRVSGLPLRRLTGFSWRPLTFGV